MNVVAYISSAALQLPPPYLIIPYLTFWARRMFPKCNLPLSHPLSLYLFAIYPLLSNPFTPLPTLIYHLLFTSPLPPSLSLFFPTQSLPLTLHPPPCPPSYPPPISTVCITLYRSRVFCARLGNTATHRVEELELIIQRHSGH